MVCDKFTAVAETYVQPLNGVPCREWVKVSSCVGPLHVVFDISGYFVSEI